MQRIARDRLLDLRQQDIVVTHNEIANGLALAGRRHESGTRHPAVPGNWTMALVKVDRAPRPALAPMTPARPMVAVSTVAPLRMTATSETMPVCGK
jgi:hypothetical protein